MCWDTRTVDGCPSLLFSLSLSLSLSLFLTYVSWCHSDKHNSKPEIAYWTTTTLRPRTGYLTASKHIKKVSAANCYLYNYFYSHDKTKTGNTNRVQRILVRFLDVIYSFNPGRPFVLFLDDLHWADQSSLDLLRTLVKCVPLTLFLPSELELLVNC